MQLTPIFLKLKGRRVVCVGGGRANERKIEDLVNADALVVVIAPEATLGVQALATAGRLAWEKRAYQKGDVRNAWLVVSASGDPHVQKAVLDDAERERVFVLAVDDPENGSAFSAAVVRRPPFTIAISSSGETPALARLMRQIIEHMLPPDRWVAAARELRRKWKSEGTPMESRFNELLDALRSSK